MNIIITNSAGMPIYDQIASQIKAMILSGELKEGEPLPSMRALEQTLREVEQYLSKAAETAKRCGIGYDELSEILRLFME